MSYPMSNPYLGQMQPQMNMGYNYGYGPNMWPYNQVTPQPQMQSPQAQPTLQTQQTIQSIRGRMVNDISEITPNEVPMDGTASFFPKADGSAVYVKSWNADGTINTSVFTRVDENASEAAPTDPMMARFNALDDRLDRIEKAIAKQKKFYPSQPKREGEVNG